MSQQKKKIFKDEVNQPIIKSFILLDEEDSSKEPNHNTAVGHKSRSRSRKRKGLCTPNSSEKKTQEKKRIISGGMATPIPAELMNTNKEELTLQAVKDLLSPMNDRINMILVEQTKMNETIGDAALLKEENEKLKRRVILMEDTTHKLQQRISALEDKLLETNIILTGIYEGAWETEEARREVLFEVIANTIVGRNFEEKYEVAKTMHIKHSRRIGKYRQMHNRPISITFQYREDAEYILNNRKYLPQGVYVDKEYSKETEERRRILRPYFNAARKIPKYQRKCRLEGDTLILRGLSYRVEDIEKLPTELSGIRISSKTDNNSYGFFGKLHPFSNFYPSEFTFQGIKYHSSEQMIQHLKSTYFDDEETANQILQSSTANECKQLSREISNYNPDGWNQIAKEMCSSGIRAKVAQNETIKNLLLETGTKTIVESGLDQIWGTGVKLFDPQCLQPNRWFGQGILGEILQEVREELRGLSNQDRRDSVTSTVTSMDYRPATDNLIGNTEDASTTPGNNIREEEEM